MVDGGVVNVRGRAGTGPSDVWQRAGPGGYTVSRGRFADRPVLKQSGCSDGAMARWAEKSGGSAGAAF